MMRPLQPISNTARVLLGISFFVLFVAGWAFATLGGYVSPTFLASPVTMVEDGWRLLTKYNFSFDIGITIWRVVASSSPLWWRCRSAS
jgi:NitT/TauT family transport system permease protein